MAVAPLSGPGADDRFDAEELARHFSACRLPKALWTHQAHLVVGLWHVTHFGRDGAMHRLRTGIRRLNDSHGTVNSATSGYHETVTAAYVELLDQFLAREPAVSLDEHCARLLASPLAERNALFRFYSRAVLMSPRARGETVAPDLAPLSLDSLYLEVS